MSKSKVALSIIAASAIAAAAYYRNKTLEAAPSLTDLRPRIAFVVGGPDPFWDIVIAGAKDAAKEFNAELALKVPAGSGPDQTTELAKLNEDQIDGLAVSPLDPDEQTRLLSTIATKVNVVTYDNDAPTSLRHCYVGTNNYTAGRMSAELIQKALPEGGQIAVFVGDNKRLNARDRRLGLINALRGEWEEQATTDEPLRGPLEIGKYTIVATYLDESDPERARENAAKAIEAHPELDCMVGLYGYNGPACLEALAAAEKAGKIKVVAFDEHDATLAGIAEGTVFGTVVQDPYLYGYESVRILCSLARGKTTAVPLPGAGSWTLPCSMVTGDNLKTYQEKLEQRKAKIAKKGEAA